MDSLKVYVKRECMMTEAMIRFGLDGRAYEYDIAEDCVIVWATNVGATPRILARFRL